MPDAKYRLTVYIAGMTPAAAAAIANLDQLCQDCTGPDSYDVEIVDILENPQAAEDALILATPTVIKSLPPPMRRVIGDLSERDTVIMALGLERR